MKWGEGKRTEKKPHDDTIPGVRSILAAKSSSDEFPDKVWIRNNTAQCLTDEQMVFGVSKSVIFNSDWGSTLRPSGAPFGQGLLSLCGGVFPLLSTLSYLSAKNKYYVFLLDPYLWRWVHFQAKASVLCCSFMEDLGERGSHEAPDKVFSSGVYAFLGKKIAALTCSSKQSRLKRPRVTFTLLLYFTAGWKLKGGMT